MGFRTGPLNCLSQRLQHIYRRKKQMPSYPGQTFADDLSVHSNGPLHGNSEIPFIDGPLAEVSYSFITTIIYTY